MKKIFSILIIVSISYIVVAQSFSGESSTGVIDTKTPVIISNIPNGGEQYQTGSSITVSWQAIDDSFGASPVSIALQSSLCGTAQVIATNLPDSGSQVIQLPNIATSNLFLSVIATDIFANTSQEESYNSFSVSINEQTIPLPVEWNYFSSYIDPVFPEFDSLMSDILASVSIIKDGQGQVFWPQYGINLIGDIVSGKGYQIKMQIADTLIVHGNLLQPEITPISLPFGWSILGYIRIDTAAISNMLSPVLQNVNIVKDNQGQVFWPSYGIDLIGDMVQGKAYLINMASQDTLVYPANTGFPYPAFCPSIIYDAECNAYNTVQIGNQCWMAENLNVGIMIHNSTNGSNTNASDNGVIEKHCINNDPLKCETYGGLYSWNEMMQYVYSESTQGICPTGWHLPSDGEWKILEANVDSQFGQGSSEWDQNNTWRGFDAGGALKETGNSFWDSPNTGATNSSGFSALPGGYRTFVYSGNYIVVEGSSSNFWTSSGNFSNFAISRTLSFDNNKVLRYYNLKMLGFSVRCIKD
ncbi:MAG: FISUMP domain-containing protein [Bacteroidota bacterium]|nr:FISUMP domain-containing protein [Bacteroidota bacterium]